MMGYSWPLFGLPRAGRAKTAVLGVVYDSSSALGKGTAAFPIAIRLASRGLEWEEPTERGRVDVSQLDAVDVGDVFPCPNPDFAVTEIEDFLSGLWDEGFRRFLVLGGNHSITIPVVQFLHEKGAVKKYVQFDAHADARDMATGTPHSFACTFRRVAEALGPENCSLVGVRSVAAEEADFVEGVQVVYGHEMDLARVASLVRAAGYVSVDIDVLEHASVTNPEPHSGMTLGQVLETMGGPKAGFDVVEGVPTRYFGDPTATAAALLARKALVLMGGESGQD